MHVDLIGVSKAYSGEGAVMMLRALAMFLGLILVLIGICPGQERGGSNDEASADLIENILRKAQVSGSLEYWGRCDLQQPLPDFPRVRPLLRSSDGPPLPILREIFSDDAKMRVTQESDGTIRMVESDVPKDLLKVRITHISFMDEYDSLSATLKIVHAREVQSFMKTHDIRGQLDGRGQGVRGVIQGPSPVLPRMTGDLDNVTVAQALDHVSKTFRGFWVYENCRSENRSRVVLFWFFRSFQKIPHQETP